MITRKISSILPIDQRTDAYAIAKSIEGSPTLTEQEARNILSGIVRFGRGRSVQERVEAAFSWLAYKFPKLYVVEKTLAGNPIYIARRYYSVEHDVRETEIALEYREKEEERKNGQS